MKKGDLEQIFLWIFSKIFCTSFDSYQNTTKNWFRWIRCRNLSNSRNLLLPKNSFSKRRFRNRYQSAQFGCTFYFFLLHIMTFFENILAKSLTFNLKAPDSAHWAAAARPKDQVIDMDNQTHREELCQNECWSNETSLTF